MGTGSIDGVLIAYGRIVPFIDDAGDVRLRPGPAERISNRQTQSLTVDGFPDFFRTGASAYRCSCSSSR